MFPSFGIPFLLKSSSSSPLLEGLVRFYPLDGNGDDVHGGEHGVITGASPGYEAGLGQTNALYLGDSTTNRFEALEFRPNDFTISWQVYARGNFNAFAGLIGNFNTSSVTSDWCFLCGGVTDALVYANGNANTGKLITLPTLSWHHIVLTREVTAWKLYYDGTLVESFTSLGAGSSGTDSFYIASRPDGYTTTNARFQKVGLWNRALTDAEVTTLYNSGNVLAYPFTI